MGFAELIMGNLLLASLIGVLAMIVGRGGRRAMVAHALWVMFFVKLITPPIVSVPLPIPSLQTGTVADVQLVDAPTTIAQQAATEKHVPKHADVEATRQSGSVPSAVPVYQAAISQRNWISSVTWSRAVLSIWFIGFSFLVVRGLVRLVRFRRLIVQCGTFDDQAAETVRGFLSDRRGGIFRRRAPSVVRVSVRVSPMLFGFALRPMIVCPEELWQTLSPQDRRAFLAHETAHFRRKDHWVRWLEWFVSAVYWWFPGVHFAQRQLERHEEACCDAWAVKMLETKPRRYAEALLRVVDFISDYEVGLPSLASGMQPTDTLEERLRLLMRNELEHAHSRLHTWGSGLTCAAIWMVHPDAYHLQWTPDSALSRPAAQASERLSTLPAIDTHPLDRVSIEAALPKAPVGFWNAPPPVRHWAGFTFEMSDYRLSAVAGRGFVITGPLGQSIPFSEQTLTAISEVPTNGRVIIGDAKGNVRLWDLNAGMPVSLLGCHTSAVTSLAVTAQGQVYSADASGQVMRWEMQSGQTLASWSRSDFQSNYQPGTSFPSESKTASSKTLDRDSQSSSSVQSIRASSDGNWIAVLCGDWRETYGSKTLHLLDAHTLVEHARHPTPPDTAIVLQTGEDQWCAINWSGDVRSMESMQQIGTIEKHRVSALILSQHASTRYETIERPAVQ